MNKEFILNEIRRSAVDGEALGREKFERVTGIRVSDWRGKYWARWSDAVKEAGYKPNSLQPSLEFDELALAMIEMIRHYEKYPTQAEVQMYAEKCPEMPNCRTFDKFGGQAAFAKKLVEYCSATSGLDDVIGICRPVAGAISDAPKAEATAKDSAADEYVYLMKQGKNYKIGKSNDTDRRRSNLATGSPEHSEMLHKIKTRVPFLAEKFWKDRFEEKHVRGEWYALDAEDIRTFKRCRFM
ncbi:T5orf172 domain protein [Posidoniimonas corsicana]|uniref:T5orf172 domain protein n=1 Tax=Posidoniimonas corsicana TaxID=1938618 RepID=A0A5C5UZ31_9BACT|nr:GIY-YIG nuclease family protein [Posidoniimonas corsicana]TWT31109.1 T5orf172 domain protein [Posidoniimonas corsicana]